MAAKNDKKYRVILAYMGGPENKNEVRPFLANLFNDPHIMRIPQPFRFLIAQTIAFSRAKKAWEHYDEIGGGSPLKKLTAIQAGRLANVLHDRGYECTVDTGYSYCQPFIREAVAKCRDNDIDRIIAIPLYPQYSVTTFGSVEDNLKKAAKKCGLSKELKIIPPYYDHPLYIEASVDLMKQAVERLNQDDPYRVVFTAHALPQAVIDRGDPYRTHVEKTVSLILEKFTVSDYVISYQSKIGPVKWMQPSTVETVKKAGRDGVKQLVVVPVGFTCDHVETLHELDIELAEIAHKAGIKKYVRAGVFNDHPKFIELLAELVIKEINA